jgi:predicted Zn-dependent peptidase
MTRLILLLCASLTLPAQDFKGLEQKVTDFSLPNGFRFILVERHDSPAVSFVVHVGAGTVNDSPGLTGLASFFERLTFKGTESLGTRDAASEKKALDSLEEAYARLDGEKAKGRRASDLDVVRIETEIQKAGTAAQMYAAPDEFRSAFDENGASVSTRIVADSSQIRIALPSNRAELWFLLEAQWLARPVFRDFYRERDQLAPPRTRESEVAATKALQALASTAFTQHGYRNPPLGWPAEFSQLRHSDARQFFNRYYVPGNITIGIAGDIRPEEARRLAEKYFGAIAARPVPPAGRAPEPPQAGPRTTSIENAPEQFLAIGFKRPDQLDRDNAALEVLQAVLTGSRSSLLARELLDSRSAENVASLAAYPGGRSPSLFTILVKPAAGHNVEENEKAVLGVLSRLQKDPVDEETLGRAKGALRGALARRLSDNSSIAAILAQYASEYGDWRAAFAASDAIAKVTAAQVQLAAVKYLVSSRRTTVSILQPAPVPASKGAAK